MSNCVIGYVYRLISVTLSKNECVTIIITATNIVIKARQMLMRHMKIHMIHKPHICQHCEKGYAESHSLTKHMRKHLGIPREKRHFCEECGQGYVC